MCWVTITPKGSKIIRMRSNTRSRHLNFVKQRPIKDVVEEIKNINIKEFEEKIVYDIEFQKKVKILALIKANMPITVKINVENGEVVRIEKVWWSFAATSD